MRRYELTLIATLLSEGPSVCLDKPISIHEYLAPFYAMNPLQESFFVVCLNRRNFAIGAHRISLGSLVSTIASPREVFRIALLEGGTAAIVVGHNHPSGFADPSSADIMITRGLRDASKVLDIELLDHVISGEPSDAPNGRAYYSFREAGLL